MRNKLKFVSTVAMSNAGKKGKFSNHEYFLYDEFTNIM